MAVTVPKREITNNERKVKEPNWNTRDMTHDVVDKMSQNNVK